MSFEITFLGASGGPIESSNCGLLIKPAGAAYADMLAADTPPVLAVDAGAGLYALAEIISDAAAPLLRMLQLYHDLLPLQAYFSMPLTRPWAALAQPLAFTLACALLCRVRTLLLSHPHLDHVLALVLNLPSQQHADTPLAVYGLRFTVDALHAHVFNGVIWPDMHALGLLRLEAREPTQPFLVCGGAYAITMFDLSHGVLTQNGAARGTYLSLAFLVCEVRTRAKLLVFGDFEADLVLRLLRNHAVWAAAARHVDDGSLKCIILECSSASVRHGTPLYGHLLPRHLMAELQTLHALCAAERPFEHLHVIVTHVKEVPGPHDPRRRVLAELRALNDELGLGLRLSVAVSGVLVVV